MLCLIPFSPVIFISITFLKTFICDLTKGKQNGWWCLVQLLLSPKPTLCQRVGVTHTGKATMKTVNKQQQHAHAPTRLEADAVLISVLVVKPLAAQIAAGVPTMGGRGCLHKGEYKNKGFTRRKQPPVLKPVNLRQDEEEFLKFLFYFYRYLILWREIRADGIVPPSVNRISTFLEAAPQNGGAANLSTWWRQHARLQKTNKHLHEDGLAVSMGVGRLYSTSLVHIRQSTAATLCAAAHAHPRWVKEGETGRGREEWEGGVGGR